MTVSKITLQKRSHSEKLMFLTIIFFHAISVIACAYYDKGRHFAKGKLVNLNELKYWLWFFTWWSAWTSLLTVPWSIYKLLFANGKKKPNYNEQLCDLIITEINLISGVIYCCGGFLLTFHSTKSPYQISYPFLGNVRTLYVYLFYNVLWHILAPGLALYYFWKYCQVDKLASKKRTGLVANLIIPTIYLFYIMLRPLVANVKPHNAKSYHYPQDYPYAPFFWIAGKTASHLEESNNYFWSNWPSWIKTLLWLSITIVGWYLIFSFLFLFLIKSKLNNTKKNNSIKNVNFKTFNSLCN